MKREMAYPGALSLLGGGTEMPFCWAVPPTLEFQTSSPSRILLGIVFVPFLGSRVVLWGKRAKWIYCL